MACTRRFRSAAPDINSTKPPPTRHAALLLTQRGSSPATTASWVWAFSRTAGGRLVCGRRVLA